MQAWVQEELQTGDIGDERLDARFKVVLNDLSAKPSVSIPAACGGWTETLAAYRFFGSRRVDAKHVLQPHSQATLKRIAEQSVVLIPQDTTELDVTRPKQQMTGAGPLNDESRLGFYDHVLLAITPERIPLGVIAAEIWARDLKEFRQNQREKQEDPRAKAKKDRARPIEEKESVRWLKGYRRACAVAEQCPDTQIVAISDSEGDVYECFEEATRQDGGKKADWIVRACQNRGLCGAYPQVYRRLREQVASTRVLGTMDVEVQANTPKIPSDRKRNQPRSARTATVTIRATRVKVRGPQRPGGRARDVELNAILVREEDPPKGEEPLEWLLLTSLPIKSFKQVRLVIEYYACRWEIDIFQPHYESSAVVYQTAA